MDSKLEKISRFGNFGYVRRGDLGEGIIEIRCYDENTCEEISRVNARTAKLGSYDVLLPDKTYGRKD